MPSRSHNRICPAEKAGSLDNRLRRLIQNPQKILAPYVKKGMTVLDVGCGPGFFSIDMAYMVGEPGRVIAADLQEEMLQRVSAKIKGTALENRMTLHKCDSTRIGLNEKVDFVLLFYVVHEVSNAEELFGEIATLLKPGGRVLIVEPPFHVSKSAFANTIEKAPGFIVVERPRYLFSKAVVLRRN